MNKSQILSIDPKGNITCYDKEGNFRIDLNSNDLSNIQQFEVFGRIMIMNKKESTDFIKDEDTKSNSSKRTNLFKKIEKLATKYQLFVPHKEK